MTHIDFKRTARTHPTAPHRGEIWLAEGLPFDDGVHSKDRPVLICRREGDVFVCYKCTSKRSEHRERYEISDLDSAGLRVASYIDYSTVRVPREKLMCMLGVLSEEDRTAFGRLRECPATE